MVNNHFDLFWRRGLNEALTFKGKRFAPYSAIHDQYIKRNIDIAAEFPEYKFEVESAAVLRGVLQRHPEYHAPLKALCDAGRFIISGTGDNIIDSNMVLGETLVRNYLYGIKYAEKAFGRRSFTAVRLDAFGNSAQMPQIMKKCGFKRTARLTYVEPDKQIWKGLDDTEIFSADLPEAGRAYGAHKLPPCEYCNGNGCQKCDATGMTLCLVEPPEIDSIDPDMEVGEVVFLPEELLPNIKIKEWFKAMQEKFDTEFTLHDDQNKYIPEFAAETPGVYHSCELNPASTGCYVSRIKLKQTCRRQENELLALEVLLWAASQKGLRYPAEKIEVIWQKLFQTLFHDSVTGTVVDAPYQELRNISTMIDRMLADNYQAALKKLTVADKAKFTILNLQSAPFTGMAQVNLPLNEKQWYKISDDEGNDLPVQKVEYTEKGCKVTFSVKDVAPFSAKVCNFEIVSKTEMEISEAKVISNHRFRITADEHGLLEIFDLKLDRIISKAAQYRPAEIIFESDEGSPWATLTAFQARSANVVTTFDRMEKLVSRQSLFFNIRVSGCGKDSFHPFEAVLEVTLAANSELADFHLHVKRYDSFNSRIRVAFPMPFAGENYGEIPFGTLKREYYIPDFSLNGTNGDWPVVNWGGTQSDKVSVALFNRGTPSYKWEETDDGELMLLSILRSPVIPTFLHEWKEYVMTDFDGMRDTGEHAFDFALTAYAESFARSTVTDDAAAYSVGVKTVPGVVTLPEFPEKIDGPGRIAAVKMAENGQDTILRLAEYQGAAGRCRIKVPEKVTAVSKCDMLENPQKKVTVNNGVAEISLKPWEIATIKLS